MFIDLERIRRSNLQQIDQRRTVGQARRELFNMPEYRRDLQARGIRLPPSRLPPPPSRIQQIPEPAQPVAPSAPSSRSVSPMPEHAAAPSPAQIPPRTVAPARTAARRRHEEQMTQQRQQLVQNILSQAYRATNPNQLEQVRNTISRNRVGQNNLRARRTSSVSQIRLPNNVTEAQRRSIARLYKMWCESVREALKKNEDTKRTLRGPRRKSECAEKHNQLKFKIADLEKLINDAKDAQDVELLESTVFEAIEIIFQDRYICSGKLW